MAPMRDFEDNTYLNVANAPFLAELYERYLENPANVDASWQAFFKNMNDNKEVLEKDFQGVEWAKRNVKIVGAANGGAQGVAEETAADSDLPDYAPKASAIIEGDRRSAQPVLDTIRAIRLIHMYRVRGHFLADLDPLGLETRHFHPELEPSHYGFGEDDMDREIFIGGAIAGVKRAPLSEIIRKLRKTYCSTVGVEYQHIDDHEIKEWLQYRIETIDNHTEFSHLGQKTILQRLIEAEEFEKFLHTKYVGTKRFGIDGGESLIPAIEQILKKSSELGVKEAVIGMPHRGRLNMICNIMDKPYYTMLAEFEGNHAEYDDILYSSGDVKYHLGTSTDRDLGHGKVHLSLTPNPSHLEAVDPVVLGKVRAKQDQRGDEERATVMGILLHGDAAFAGQGVVSECLLMSELRGYKTGGTIHFVVNNQIGFTTDPEDGRSSDYCSDIAKMVKCPILHVNGDDAEAVVHAARVAAEYRAEFQKDVVVDMYCYRRFGHNEGDEPAFTQPKMYKTIKAQRAVSYAYQEALEAQGLLDDGEADKMREEVKARLEKELEKAREKREEDPDWLKGAWTGMEQFDGKGPPKPPTTGAKTVTLKKVGECLTSVPEDFNLNKKIARLFETKKEMFKSGEGFDWATAEALAFGTLLMDGHPVRLSGQDVERATFSQRHAAVIDQETTEKYISLQHLKNRKAEFEVRNSPLSEYGVLGFEYGYTQAEPNALVMWEAQFGDFSNGAQIIIDQFISSAEAKWLRMSGLVMLLPHGFEGQGPEHSSARLERYLQLCAEFNMRVANCSTPANYFHILRRQLMRNYRKPLVLITPKSLLRHKLCVSTLKDMAEDTNFTHVYDEVDKIAAKDKVKRVVICSGKVYYDLLQTRRDNTKKASDTKVAIIRLEQFYPFPEKQLAKVLKSYKNADVVWCQEEPENMGAWFFVDRRIEKVLAALKNKGTAKNNHRPVYVGRPSAASPATGIASRHQKQQQVLVDEALKV